jgi:hypothetical protein
LFWREVSPAVVTVPKATVHENDELGSGENEIWFAQQRIISPPTFQFCFPQQGRKAHFGCLISRTANS